jgi:hypothetical protein
MTDFLTKILNNSRTHEEIYQSYFEKTFWTISEFCSLMAGLTPDEFEKIDDKDNKTVTETEFKKYCHANKIYKKIVNWINKDIPIEQFYWNGEEMILTPYKYVKWSAENQIPFKKKFVKSLPLYLLEVILESQPIEKTIKTRPQWGRDYHEAIYLKNAEQIINKSKKRLSREEIYNHLQMKYIEMTFKNKDGTRKKYKKRTITESWLRKIDHQKRGRPRKKPLKPRHQ